MVPNVSVQVKEDTQLLQMKEKAVQLFVTLY